MEPGTRTRVSREQPDQFGIEISFEPHSEAPSRVFRAISYLIESFELTDQMLAQTLSAEIRPILLLENVESASVLVWLKSKLESVDDGILASGDYKKAVGAFLVKGKKIIIDYCERRTTIGSRAEMEELQSAILSAASETDVLQIPAYQPPTPALLVDSIQRITDSTRLLNRGDSVHYLSAFGDSIINRSFSVSPEATEDLLIKEAITNDAQMILRIKKPDFLGDSMWDFQHERRTISAKISHAEWLAEFRNGQHGIQPGDALRALVGMTARYGFDADVVSTQFEVIQVLEVLKADRPSQGLLPT